MAGVRAGADFRRKREGGTWERTQGSKSLISNTGAKKPSSFPVLKSCLLVDGMRRVRKRPQQINIQHSKKVMMFSYEDQDSKEP